MKRLLIFASLTAAVIAAGVGYSSWKSHRQVEIRNTNICLSNLRIIDGAKQLYVLEHGLKPGDVIPTQEVIERLTELHVWPLKCPSGGTYMINPVGKDPTCSVPGHQLQ
jgi:hypothetical protein